MKAGTSRDPSWWEYASDACSELDKGKGVALEEIIRHIDGELFPGQDRTCRSEVEAALTASVKSGHIFLSSVSTASPSSTCCVYRCWVAELVSRAVDS